MNSAISLVLFTLKVGKYYSKILQEEVLFSALITSYQVPRKGDIIKKYIKFEDDDEIEKQIEYTLEVQSIHYIIEEFGEATITVYANVINEKLVGDK